MESRLLILSVLAISPAYCVEMGQTFSSLYSITNLGSVQGVPPPYSSLLFQAGNPNVILLGGDSTFTTGQIYTVSVTRDVASQHVSRLGTPTPYVRAPNIDGGLIYAPNGDILFTQYPINQIAEITPNNSSPAKIVPAPFGMPALGTAKSESTGSLQIVPAGFTGAGNLVMDSVDTSEFCAASLSPDSSGTYNIGACVATVTGSGKTEGVIYVPAGTPGFTGETMLVAEFGGGQVVAYSVDSNGLPVLASAQIFISGIHGVQGATIDPTTGDFFFSTYSQSAASGNEVFEVSLIPMGPTPTVTSVVDPAASTDNLTPGMPILVTGTVLGSSASDVATLTIGTEVAPVLTFNSSTSVIAQVPVDAPLGATSLTATYKGQSSAAFNLKLVALAPEIEPAASANSSSFYDSSGNLITLAHPAVPNSEVYALAIGLGTTSPAQVTDTVATAQASTTQQVQVMLSNQMVQPDYAGLFVGGTPGYYQVSFKVPADAAAGNQPVTLLEGGLTSNIAMLAVAPPVAAVNAVVNGASFAGGGVVPGEIATAFGTNLTAATGINLTSGLPLPTTFLHDALTVDNQAVALFAVDNANGQQQINFQVPWRVAAGGNVMIAVSDNGSAGTPISLPVLAAQPGIFNYSLGGNTFGAILHANFALANTANPAKPGETVLIYCTGLGAVDSPPEDGAAGNGQTTMVTPEVTIGGTKAMVSFSGLAPGFVGLYQVNAAVPAGLKAGNQPVVIAVSKSSSNTVLLPVL